MPLRGKGGKSKGGRSNTRREGTAPDTPIIGPITDIGTGRAYNDGAVVVNFTPASTGTPATSYTVTASSGQTATGNSSPLTITGIASGASVTVVVRANNQYGSSANSASSSAVTVTTVPATPSAPSASSPSAGTDSVSWSAPANGGKAITNYYWTSSDGKSGNTTSTSVNVSQEQGTSQTYNVRADNANGSSQTSANSGSVTTTFSFAPFSVFGFSPFNVFGFSPTPPFNVFGFSPFNVFGFSPTPPFNVFGFSPSPPFSVFGFSPTAFSVFGFSPTSFSVFGFSPTSGGGGGFSKMTSVFGETKLRTPNGLVLASTIQPGDQLLSVVLPGLSEEGWTIQDVINWNMENPSFDFSNENLVTTTVLEVISNTTNKIVFINSDAFSATHAILVKRDNVAQMMLSDNVLETDQIWSLQHNGWIPVTAIDKYEAEHVVYSINTEPYDLFFTESMLVHDTRPDIN